jgi:hypothetical protein
MLPLMNTVLYTVRACNCVLGMENIIPSHRSSWDMAASQHMNAEVNSSSTARMHATSLDPGIL